MTRWLTIAIVSSLAVACDPSTREIQAPLDPEVVVYEVDAAPDEGALEVTVTLPKAVAGTRACAPSIGTRRGESLAWRGAWADSEPVALDWGRDGCFQLPEFENTFRARYRVAIEPTRSPSWRAISLSPVADRDVVVFPGESVFFELEGSISGDLAARASIQSAETVTGSWPSSWISSAAGALELAVGSNQDLVSSHLAIGPKSADVGSVALAVDSRLPDGTADRLSSDAQCLVSQLGTWVEGRHDDAAVLALLAGWDRGASSGFSRGDGVVIQMGPDSMLDDTARRTLLAHELFHRHNGEGLRFAEAAFEETTWFREGGTSYVSTVALVQSGLLGQAFFVEKLAEHASNYVLNPASQVAQASELDWRRLPYDRGVLLSLAIDLMLRDVSAGARSLRGFWLYLSRQHSWEQPQSNESLQRLLTEYGGFDFAPFFERYVIGREPIPVHALMRNAGLSVEHGTRNAARYDMEVEYDVDSGQLYVARLGDGGVAETAGVKPGDMIIPTDQTRFDGAGQVVEFMAKSSDGEERFVRLWPRVVPEPALFLTATENAPFTAVLAEVGPVAACSGAE